MATVLVSAFKTRVSSIPTAQNTNRIIFDPATDKLVIISGYTRGAKGEHMYTVVSMLDLADLTLDA
jgi:hypothetical protein